MAVSIDGAGGGDEQDDENSPLSPLVPERDAVRQAAQVTFWFSVVCVASLIMSVGNKLIMVRWRGDMLSECTTLADVRMVFNYDTGALLREEMDLSSWLNGLSDMTAGLEEEKLHVTNMSNLCVAKECVVTNCSTPGFKPCQSHEVRECGFSYSETHFQSFPNILCLVQNGITFLFLLTAYATNTLDFQPITQRDIMIFALPSLFLTLEILTSLLALPLVALATVVVFRNISLCLVAVGDYFIFGTTFNNATIAALAVIVSGSLLYAWQDIQFDANGYWWLSINAVLYVISNFYNKWFITNSKQSSYGIALIVQGTSLPFIISLAAAGREFDDAGAVFSTLGSQMQVFILFTGLACMMLTVGYNMCYKMASGTAHTSFSLFSFYSSYVSLLSSQLCSFLFSPPSFASPATSVTIVGNFSKALSIIAGYVIFNTTLSALQVLGLLICMGGTFWYSLEMRRAKEEADAAAANKVKAVPTFDPDYSSSQVAPVQEDQEQGASL
jgi:drug/metabolite transporter (DMT)-like permease